MNLRLIAALMSSSGSINRRFSTTAYSYPHIYLQFNKNKIDKNQLFTCLFGFFKKNLKCKLYFCFAVDNFLITYGCFMTKHDQSLHANRAKESSTLDPSKRPLTQKKIVVLLPLTFFTSPAIASHTGGPYNSAPFDNRIDVKALV